MPQAHPPAAAQPDLSVKLHADLLPVTFLDKDGRAVTVTAVMKTAAIAIATAMMNDVRKVDRSKTRLEKLKRGTEGTHSFDDEVGSRDDKNTCLVYTLARKACVDPQDGIFVCKQCFNGRWFCIRPQKNKLVVVTIPKGAKPDKDDDEMLDNGDGDVLSEWVRSPTSKSSGSYNKIWY
jgi:hypothetical protein